MSRSPKVVFDVGNVLLRWDPFHLYRDVIPDDAKRDWFLKNVCIRTPAIARVDPTSIATRVRGRRMLKKTAASKSDKPG